MTNRELTDRAQKVLFQNYRTQPVALVRGEGTAVWDADGKKYLDFIGGIATVSVGHANPRVREAVLEQTKLARRWHVDSGHPERIEIVCMNNSFHGRTMGSLAATGQPKYQQGFGPLPAGFRFVDYGDVKQIEEAVTGKTCAVLLEPLQGEAGVITAPAGYLKAVRELCTRRGALMLLDEVQTGMGRTGKMFAHQHEGVEPDAMSLAKGIE